ncbi:MAG TPA: aminotransferase class V-fold PLP-dependent enzyme [Chitinophagaceae bacterium]|nr:aminotransferase class V-fold PLP-dependent enzyme [Chitinophagaceae bacterium]
MDIAQKIFLPANSVFTKDEVQKFRNETSGTRNVIHLNNAGAGLMPDVVTKAQLDHIKLESEIGGYEAADLRADTINAFYEEAALLFNCKPSNIAFTASATDSYTRALSSIPFKKGNIILTDKDNFVSNQIQFLSLQKRFGIKIIHINNAPIGGVDLNDLEEKLKKHQPKLLTITHIPTNSGLVQPVNEIAQIFRQYSQSNPGKSWYILDACQSLGQMKLDVQKLHCDFLSVTCRKYLRGPRGTGALFISDKVLNAGLEPMFIDMRGAEWTQRNKYKQQPDSKRFEDWEFAYSAVIGTKAAIEYCRAIGEDKIWQQVKLISGYLRNELSTFEKVKIVDRGAEKASSVTFQFAHSTPEFIVQELRKRKINVVASYRAYGLIDFDEKGVKWVIRVSPHYYNTVPEIDNFIEALKEIIKTK